MELPKQCVLVISDGRAKIAELHPHAETKIFTYKGKVKRVNFEEGEDF
ncbi:XtrA/YqaO family protein [Planococcus rifietoensis]